MNYKSKQPQFVKPQNTYSSASPKKPLYCDRATNTIQETHSRRTCRDGESQTSPMRDEPFERDYLEALRYINECHDVINEMYMQSKGSLRVPEVPNFIDMYMHCHQRALGEAGQHAVHQNISQTHCTLIDSPRDVDSTNMNNLQEYSSPDTDQSDYELLAEPLKTLTKNQADLQQAKSRDRKCVLQDCKITEEEECINTFNDRDKQLDILFEANANWRVSDHGETATLDVKRPQSRNKIDKAEVSLMEFNCVAEEIAQQTTQKFTLRPGISNTNCCSATKFKPVGYPPLLSHVNKHDQSKFKTELSSHQRNIYRDQRIPKTLQSPIIQYHVQNNEVHASQLLQKRQTRRGDQECQLKLLQPPIRDIENNHSEDKIPFYKPSDLEMPNSFERPINCSKRRSKECFKKAVSDSDIDDDCFREEANHNQQKHRSSTNDAVDHRSIARPNRTELISTLKYGRKIVMRTELPPSEHPNFRQQRQRDESDRNRCSGDSSDISSDPEFLLRQ